MIDTYFLVFHDGRVERKDVNNYHQEFWQQMPMKLAAEAHQIIKLTPYGRGYTVKDRTTGKRQYFTRKEMLMMMLRAES